MTATPESWILESRRFGLDLSISQVATLLQYLRRILDENTRVNLTAIRDFDAALSRHLLDSLAFGLHLKDQGLRSLGLRMLDLGTGAGFPGVVAAIACPDAHVHLVDSRGKKLEAIRRALGDLPVPNVSFHHARLQELAGGRSHLTSRIDLLFARGVGTLAAVVDEAAAALVPGSGTLLCWKSAGIEDDERAEGLSHAAKRQLERLPDLPYESFKPCILVRYRRAGGRR